MYFLMLLATFISAIYGYNLSPREDYERDLIYKKALSVLYKFMWQEHVVYKYALPVLNDEDGTSYERLHRNVVTKVTSGEKFYGAMESDCDDCQPGKTLIMKPNVNIPGSQNSWMHSKWKAQLAGDIGSVNDDSDADFLPPGRSLYNGEEMMTKFLCLKNGDLSDPDANIQSCDGQDHGSNSGGDPSVDYCCQPAYKKYLVSYKKIDVRFINRLSNTVAVDFYRIFTTRQAKENIGYIYWDGTYWQFMGKIGLTDVYKDEIEAWNADDSHYHIEEDEEGNVISKKLKISFPSYMKQKTRWTLNNNAFNEGYFTDKNNNAMCGHGCLFRIREIE